MESSSVPTDIVIPERIKRLGAKLLPVHSQDHHSPNPAEIRKAKAPRRSRFEAVDAEELDLFPGESYGIRLDPLFLAIDFDHMEFDDENLHGRLPSTLRVKTPRGEHWIYKVPKGRRVYPRKFGNGPNKERAGEMLHLNYIIGPGSVINGKSYAIVNDVEPIEAPDWVCDMMSTDFRLVDGGGLSDPDDGIEKFPAGGRDNNLTALAGYLRNQGFNAAGIENALEAFRNNGLIEQPQGDMITHADTRRIAQSIARKERGFGADNDTYVGGAEFIPAVDLPAPTDVLRWILFGYIPHDALSLVYGAGGVGKSRWLAYVAAVATRKGMNVGYLMHEDDPYRFMMQHKASGGNNALLYSAREPHGFKFPSRADRLIEQIESRELKLVIFDAVYSHFDDMQGKNAAEKARTALEPLSRIARERKCTIIGNFHENKSGNFLGSTEMENVARVLIHATLPEGRDFRVTVEKTNHKEPDRPLEYKVHETPYTTDAGVPVMEEKEDGTIGPAMLPYYLEGKKGAPVIIGDGELLGEPRKSKLAETAPVSL